MNNHLNLFRFFNESAEKQFIENNLSRAFALCLMNNSFFLNEYVRGIVTPDDYQYLFSSISSDTACKIDIQIDTATADTENYKAVYAVAMTSDRKLDMGDFLSQSELPDKRHITDILIAIKDIAIIIEVKRTGEDCKAQLYNQVLPFFKSKNKIEVRPKRFSWQEAVNILEKVKHVQQLAHQDSVLINDFLELSEIRYPEWFDPKPFNVIPFLAHGGATNDSQLTKRMRQALAGVSKIAGDEYPPLSNRLGISVPFGWASEVIPEFHYHDDNVKEYVAFYIWPANTKQQGYSIFTRSLDWTKRETLPVAGKDYELEIYPLMMLRHFNHNVASLAFSETDLVKPLITPENFYDLTGKWHDDKWKEFEESLDEHFTPEFKWRDKCNWADNFTNTDRSYLTMSLGFTVGVWIPFSTFKAIDKTETDIAQVSAFVAEIVKSFKGLIPSQ